MAQYAVITFKTTHFAFKADKVLRKNGKEPEMIPVPREFSSDCGFCCKVAWEERREVENILRNNNVEIDNIFQWEKDNGAGREKRGKYFNE